MMNDTASTNPSVSENTPAPRVYTVPEAMKILRISRATIYKAINSGQLRSYLEGRARRVSEGAINDYIAGKELEATAQRSA